MRTIYLVDYLSSDGWYLTQNYGINHETYSVYGLLFHEGCDFGHTNKKIPVKALHDGIVVQDWDTPKGNYGSYIVVWDEVQLIATWYCHLEKVNKVDYGQKVKAGQVLGEMGGTGNVTGEHLHLNLVFTNKNGYRLYNNKQNNLGFVDPKHSLDKLRSVSLPDVPEYKVRWKIPQVPTMDQSKELKTCLAAYTKLVDELTTLKKKYEEETSLLKNKNTELYTELDKTKTSLKEERSKWDNLVRPLADILGSTQQPSTLIAEVKMVVENYDKAIKRASDLEFDRIKHEKQIIELEGEVEKLQQQLNATVDLTVYDLEQLLKAVLQKLIKIIKE